MQTSAATSTRASTSAVAVVDATGRSNQPDLRPWFVPLARSRDTPVSPPTLMPNLLVMSFEGPLSPSFTLHQSEASGRPGGWRVGYYGHGEASATVFKEVAPPQGERRPNHASGIEQLASSQFIVQVQRARWGREDRLANTQPFLRSWRGRDWLFAHTHAGSIRHRPEVPGERLFEPVGSTDSELLFCELLNNVAERRWPSLGHADLALMHQWFAGLNDYGTLSAVLGDGRDLVVYADREAPMQLWTLTPPHGSMVFRGQQLEVDLAARGVKSQKGVVIASEPMVAREGCTATCTELAPGSLVVIREGAIQHRIEPGAAPDSSRARAPRIVVRGRIMDRPGKAPVRTYEVVHETVYCYERPVERSIHMLRLTPIHDRTQRLLRHELEITADCRERVFEDVFGNSVHKLLVETPFSQMRIVARSRVRVLDGDPPRGRPFHGDTIPLVWMPWQRHMLTPYLLPPELPEAQLLELSDYARGFARRNDYDLLDTVLDINATLFADYEYVPGATNLCTTAWEVYERRRGVCQDFTNLFICLARLLGVPARYVCGYIYTGPKAANRIQSEASHAWVELYLPELGWRGFDPTNGILTQTDHIRVALGRNYVDATPTSGTIYVGGGGESLSAAVRVEPISGDEAAEADDERSARTLITVGRGTAPDSPQAPKQRAQQAAQQADTEGSEQQ